MMTYQLVLMFAGVFLFIIGASLSEAYLKTGVILAFIGASMFLTVVTQALIA